MPQPRKYSSNAERQAAYRERRAAQEAARPGPVVVSPADRFVLWSLLASTKGTQARRLARLFEHDSYMPNRNARPAVTKQLKPVEAAPEVLPGEFPLF